VDCVSILGEERARFQDVYFAGDPQNASQLQEFNSSNAATYGPEVDAFERGGLLIDAYVRAQKMLESERCTKVFGTDESKANGWNPSQVLGKLMFGQGGLGSIGYGHTLGNEAFTTPTLFGVPLGTTGARISINAAAWQVENSGISPQERALTLLHELGHAFNLLYLRGSGGSKIWQGDTIPALQDYNNSLIYQECGVVYPTPRPGG